MSETQRTIPVPMCVCHLFYLHASPQLSGAVASMANFSADPCDNLWQYACGRLLDKLVLHDYVARWSWYDQLEKRTYERVQQVRMNTCTWMLCLFGSCVPFLHVNCPRMCSHGINPYCDMRSPLRKDCSSRLSSSSTGIIRVVFLHPRGISCFFECLNFLLMFTDLPKNEGLQHRLGTGTIYCSKKGSKTVRNLHEHKCCR